MHRFSTGLVFILSACGGTPESGSAPARGLVSLASGHTCETPALSGSPEQKACYAEAAKQCAEGLTPSQIEFEQAAGGPNAGQFLIKSYTCA